MKKINNNEREIVFRETSKKKDIHIQLFKENVAFKKRTEWLNSIPNEEYLFIVPWQQID